MKIYGLKLVVGFQWCPVHLPSYWLNNEGTSLSRHSDEQGFNTWHKMTTIWNASWGLPQWETHAFWTPPKIQILQQAFLAWECIAFHLKGKKIDNLLSRELSQVWMQNVITHQVVIVVCYISNCRFAIEIGVWQAIHSLEIKDHVAFALSYNVVENEAPFVMDCLLYNFIIDRLFPLFHDVVMSNLESFCQLDHHLNICHYLTKAHCTLLL